MGGGERHAGMIGQIMSRAGHDVDLIGHSDVSLRDLSDRVALDLSRTRLRVRPDRGEDELSDITAEYDLLVNATYMSRLVSKARRSAYLCFFPTPFDHDLGPVHRAAVGLVGEVDFADKLPKFGGIGAWGIQGTTMAEAREMLDHRGDYRFEPGRIYNLNGSRFIPDHSGIDGPEVAHTLWQAVLASKGQRV